MAAMRVMNPTAFFHLHRARAAEKAKSEQPLPTAAPPEEKPTKVKEPTDGRRQQRA